MQKQSLEVPLSAKLPYLNALLDETILLLFLKTFFPVFFRSSFGYSIGYFYEYSHGYSSIPTDILWITGYASGAYRPCSCLPVWHGNGNRWSVQPRKTFERPSKTFEDLRALSDMNFHYWSASSAREASYAGPKAWNDLPFALQELTDTCTFKRQLKTHLFTLA